VSVVLPFARSQSGRSSVFQPVASACGRCRAVRRCPGLCRRTNLAAKPIRVIVPLTAGSATDVIPRIVVEQVSAQVGQSILVEESYRRRWHHRCAGCRAGGSGWPYGSRALQCPHHRARGPCQSRLRRRQGFCRHYAAGQCAQRTGDPPSKGIRSIGELVARPRARRARPIMLRAVPARRRISPPALSVARDSPPAYSVSRCAEALTSKILASSPDHDAGGIRQTRCRRSPNRVSRQNGRDHGAIVYSFIG